MADFKKLGLNRVAMDVAKAVGTPTSNIQTGNLSAGEIVSLSFSASNTQTATVKPRRTGAIPISVATDIARGMSWFIEGTTLQVEFRDALTGTVQFWVF